MRLEAVWNRLKSHHLVCRTSPVLLAIGCGYHTETFGHAVGPAKPVEQVEVHADGSAGCSPKVGPAISGDHGIWRGCTQQETMDTIRAKAASLGYDGIINARCVEPGIVGNEICACTAVPYSCQ